MKIQLCWTQEIAAVTRMERQRKVTCLGVLVADRLASSDGLGARGWPRAGDRSSERAAILLMAERWACPPRAGLGSRGDDHGRGQEFRAGGHLDDGRALAMPPPAGF